MARYIDFCKNRSQTSILQIYDMKTGKVEELVRFPQVIEAPNWTRDGKYLVYNSYGQIYFYNLETGENKKLETGIANTCNNDHVLSPDGKAIAVSSGTDGDCESRIYIVDFASGDVKMVIEKPLSFLHGWSPDGKTLSYCAGRGEGDEEHWDIYTAPTDGGEEVRLTVAEGLNDGPEYAPDGKKIWFNSVRTGRMQIWCMNTDGSEQKQMTFDTTMNAWFPHVSPDGKTVVYVAYHQEEIAPGDHLPDKHVEIRMIPTAGGEEKILLKFFGGQGSMNVNSWSPDSRKFAFVSYEEEVQI